MEYFETLPPIKARLKSKNTRKKGKSRVLPWKKSLTDMLLISDKIFHKKEPEHRNRVVVLLFDSAVEVGMRAYLRLVINTKESTTESSEQDFNKLVKSVKAASKNQNLDKDTWGNIEQMHRIRNKLYHEFAEMTVEDSSILSYKAAVLDLFKKLLDIDYQ